MIPLSADLLAEWPDGIVVHDGDRIVAANSVTLRLAGADRPEAVIGQPVSALFEYPYLKAVERQLVTGSAEPGPSVFFRQRLYSLDGTVHDVDVNARLFLDGGRPTVLLVLHDVRDQVEAERQAAERREVARLVQRRQVARQIAGGVAHALNNRLQIIQGFATLLAEESLTPAQHLDVEQIMRAVGEGAEVTRQLLQFAGAATWAPQRVDLDALVRTQAPEWEEIGRPHVRSPLPLGVEPVPEVRVDPTHVRYMLSYLVANARWATRRHGNISVTVQPVVLDHARLASEGERIPRGRYVTVSVHDTGHGISANTEFHMFEPFFSTTLPGDGNGLGLSAVQGLVRQNGGYLTYDSAPGEGSTFTLWFAAGDAGARGMTLQPGESASDVTTVLIIEADPLARAATARMIERSGHRVFQAATPLEAAEVVEHLGCPALIIMAEAVEHRGGRALADLRARCATVPTLVLTPGGPYGAAPPAEGPDAVGAVVTRMASPYSEYALVSRMRMLLGNSI